MYLVCLFVILFSSQVLGEEVDMKKQTEDRSKRQVPIYGGYPNHYGYGYPLQPNIKNLVMNKGANPKMALSDEFPVTDELYATDWHDHSAMNDWQDDHDSALSWNSPSTSFDRNYFNPKGFEMSMDNNYRVFNPKQTSAERDFTTATRSKLNNDQTKKDEVSVEQTLPHVENSLRLANFNRRNHMLNRGDEPFSMQRNHPEIMMRSHAKNRFSHPFKDQDQQYQDYNSRSNLYSRYQTPSLRRFDDEQATQDYSLYRIQNPDLLRTDEELPEQDAAGRGYFPGEFEAADDETFVLNDEEEEEGTSKRFGPNNMNSRFGTSSCISGCNNPCGGYAVVNVPCGRRPNLIMNFPRSVDQYFQVFLQAIYRHIKGFVLNFYQWVNILKPIIDFIPRSLRQMLLSVCMHILGKPQLQPVPMPRPPMYPPSRISRPPTDCGFPGCLTPLQPCLRGFCAPERSIGFFKDDTPSESQPRGFSQRSVKVPLGTPQRSSGFLRKRQGFVDKSPINLEQQGYPMWSGDVPSGSEVISLRPMEPPDNPWWPPDQGDVPERGRPDRPSPPPEFENEKNFPERQPPPSGPDVPSRLTIKVPRPSIVAQFQPGFLPNQSVTPPWPPGIPGIPPRPNNPLLPMPPPINNGKPICPMFPLPPFGPSVPRWPPCQFLRPPMIRPSPPCCRPQLPPISPPKFPLLPPCLKQCLFGPPKRPMLPPIFPLPPIPRPPLIHPWLTGKCSEHPLFPSWLTGKCSERPITHPWLTGKCSEHSIFSPWLTGKCPGRPIIPPRPPNIKVPMPPIIPPRPPIIPPWPPFIPPRPPSIPPWPPFIPPRPPSIPSWPPFIPPRPPYIPPRPPFIPPRPPIIKVPMPPMPPSIPPMPPVIPPRPPYVPPKPPYIPPRPPYIPPRPPYIPPTPPYIPPRPPFIPPRPPIIKVPMPPKPPIIPPMPPVIPPRPPYVPPRPPYIPPTPPYIPPRPPYIPPGYEFEPPRPPVIPPNYQFVPPWLQFQPPRPPKQICIHGPFFPPRTCIPPRPIPPPIIKEPFFPPMPLPPKFQIVPPPNTCQPPVQPAIQPPVQPPVQPPIQPPPGIDICDREFCNPEPPRTADLELSCILSNNCDPRLIMRFCVGGQMCYRCNPISCNPLGGYDPMLPSVPMGKPYCGRGMCITCTTVGCRPGRTGNGGGRFVVSRPPMLMGNNKVTICSNYNSCFQCSLGNCQSLGPNYRPMGPILRPTPSKPHCIRQNCYACGGINCWSYGNSGAMYPGGVYSLGGVTTGLTQGGTYPSGGGLLTGLPTQGLKNVVFNSGNNGRFQLNDELDSTSSELQAVEEYSQPQRN